MRPSLSRSISDVFRQHRALRIKSRSIAAHAQVEPKLRVPDTISIPPPTRKHIEPHSLVASELSYIRKRLLSLLGTSHPGLAEAAQYYFLQPSKQIRSLVVLLFARATNGFGRHWDQKNWEAVCETTTDCLATFDDPLSQSDVLNEWNPSMPDHTTSFESVFFLHQPTTRPSYPPLRPPSNLARNLSPRLVCPPSLLPTQIRLAQIVEMVHIASLLHDSISSTEEQSNPNFFTQGHGFGNKIAILGGDFLLGRASWALSQLGESEVVELVASVISNQVEGQFLQMDRIQTPQLGLYPPPDSLSDAWDRYSRGLYLKTASLMAKAARSAVILGGCPEGNILREVAYQYGRNLGIAFQVRQAFSLERGMITLLCS
jgi:hexaprenyl-diphosphate synthase